MAVCEFCGKGVQFGHNVSHSKHATKRKWLPNIQRKVIYDGTRKRRVYICTKCLKALSKT